MGNALVDAIFHNEEKTEPIFLPALQPACPNAKRRADQPPRAQTLLPELQPAKRDIAPAHDSRSYKAEQRIAAIARTNAAPLAPPRALSHRLSRGGILSPLSAPVGFTAPPSAADQQHG